MKLRPILLLLVISLLVSCAAKRKYQDMYALWVYTDSQLQLLKQQHLMAARQKNCTEFETEIERLKKDSANLDSTYQAYMIAAEKLKSTLNEELQGQASRLKLSSAKIGELEQLLFRKDSVMKATKERLTNALVGFKERGVNVHVVGGKVYISLDERLLFPPGKVDVGAEGKAALLEIASALNQDTTTILTIEGHTDDVKYTGKAFKDNWDISVLRATSVVRLLQGEGAINPKRVIAAGRAEYFPLDATPTPEARKLNRRIEIIITPDLDEIAKLLNAE